MVESQVQGARRNTYSVDARRVRMTVWLTDAEFQEIQARADAAELSMSRYVLDAAYRGIYDPPIAREDAPILTAEFTAMIPQLHRVGMAMNDAAHWVNSYGMIPERMEEVAGHVKAAAEAVFTMVTNAMANAPQPVAQTPSLDVEVGANARSERQAGQIRDKRVEVLATEEQASFLTFKAHNYGLSRSRLLLEAALGDDTTCLPREMCKALARELWMVDIQLAGCGTNIRQVLAYVEEGTRLHATLTDTDAVTLRTVRLLNDFHVSLGR